MQLHYSGPTGEFPVYICFQAGQRGSEQRCREVRALGLDDDLQRIVLEALAPDRLAIAVATMAEVEREDAAAKAMAATVGAGRATTPSELAGSTIPSNQRTAG